MSLLDFFVECESDFNSNKTRLMALVQCDMRGNGDVVKWCFRKYGICHFTWIGASSKKVYFYSFVRALTTMNFMLNRQWTRYILCSSSYSSPPWFGTVDFFFTYHSSPSPLYYLLLLPVADLRMDPALRPRPVSSLTSTTQSSIGRRYIYSPSECVFRFYVYDRIFDNLLGFFFLSACGTSCFCVCFCVFFFSFVWIYPHPPKEHSSQ
jgi:hypothetical protein